MPRRHRHEKQTWYETQYFVPNEDWTLWERFPYETAYKPDSEKSQIRLAARHKAIKAAKDHSPSFNSRVRVIHVETIFETET